MSLRIIFLLFFFFFFFFFFFSVQPVFLLQVRSLFVALQAMWSWAAPRRSAASAWSAPPTPAPTRRQGGLTHFFETKGLRRWAGGKAVRALKEKEAVGTRGVAKHIYIYIYTYIDINE